MSFLQPADCVVFGGALVEQVVQVPRLPRTQQDNVPLIQMRTLPGGSGANVAVYLSRLGAAVRLLDRWGEDAEADLLEAGLAREGVDIDLCRRYPDLTTAFMIILTLPDHDWTGITRVTEAAQIRPQDFPPEVLASAKFLHFHGFCLTTITGQVGAAWAMEEAAGKGVQISLDACTPVALENPAVVRRFLPSCRLFFANTVEAQALTGSSDIRSMALELLSIGPRAVVIKAGEAGCYVMDSEGTDLLQIPAVPTRVIDTIGAGDGVVAGTLAGLLRGFCLSDAVRLGVAVASLSCQGMGAQSRIFTGQEAYQLANLPLKPDCPINFV
jgi:2-dehydro-3-deoxygluconokinase